MPGLVPDHLPPAMPLPSKHEAMRPCPHAPMNAESDETRLPSVAPHDLRQNEVTLLPERFHQNRQEQELKMD